MYQPWESKTLLWFSHALDADWTQDLYADFYAHLKFKGPAADHSIDFSVQEEDFFAKLINNPPKFFILFSSKLWGLIPLLWHAAFVQQIVAFFGRCLSLIKD